MNQQSKYYREYTLVVDFLLDKFFLKEYIRKRGEYL